MEKELKCITYEMYDSNDLDFKPCNCPMCGGFLKWNNGEPICNKCGTELLVIPERENGEDLGYGKICPISLPQNLTKERNK